MIWLFCEMSKGITASIDYMQYLNKRSLSEDFPSGPVVKNLPSNAGDTSPIPGRGIKIPHATGQLSPHTTTTELARLNLRCRELQSPCALEPACHK